MRRNLALLALFLCLTNICLCFFNPPISRFLIKYPEEENLMSIYTREIKMPDFEPSMYWDLSRVAFSLLPLSPGPRRKTIFNEIVPDTIWTLDQVQGIVNVNVPVRATIIRLSDGGLFVHNPVAPTKECLNYIYKLQSKYGPVKHIVLSTLGLEHKAFVGPFSRYFPKADIWLQPGQWSFPINLPNIFLGFPLRQKVKEIPANFTEAPWCEDIEHLTLGPLKFKSVGGFGETAFFHKSSKTLLVTDAIVEIPNTPPEILQDDPRALLFHARDTMLQQVEDTDDVRKKGWRRSALFSLVFFPAGIAVSSLQEVFAQLPKVDKKMTLLGEGVLPFSGGLYPWKWVQSETEAFQSLQGGLLVAPILQKLILNREPQRVLDWADKVSQWKFQRIIPCHMSNNIRADGRAFRAAFSFLEEGTCRKTSNYAKPKADDLMLLTNISKILTKFGVVAEEQPLIKATSVNINTNSRPFDKFLIFTQNIFRLNI